MNKNAWQIIKLLFFLAGVLGIAYLVRLNWLELESYSFESANYKYLLLSCICFCLCYFVGALGWFAILRQQNSNVDFLKSYYVYTLSSFLKYVPGGVWGHLTRIGSYKYLDLRLTGSIHTALLEACFAVSASLVVGSLYYFEKLFWVDARVYMAGLGVVLLIGYFSVRVYDHIAALIFNRVVTCGFAETLGIYFLYLLLLVFYGVSFSFVVVSLVPNQSYDGLIYVSAFSLAFIVGFVLVVFPGGIGVREGVLYFLLKDSIGGDAAMVVALVSRMVVVLSELVFILFSFILLLGQRENE